jgi:hypothetical protein
LFYYHLAERSVMRKLDTLFLLALLCLVPHAIRGEEAKKSNKKRSSKSSATTYSPFFIKGGQYFRYSHGQDKVAEGSPKNLKQITGLWAQVDAALMWGVKSAFLFRGKEYMRINIRTSKAGEGYPKPIEGNWPGLWPDGVDAALNVGKNKVYFFKGDEYVQYNMKSNKVVSGPKKIKEGWSGVWPAGMDASLNWDGRNIYFFKGEEYLRYNFPVIRWGRATQRRSQKDGKACQVPTWMQHSSGTDR